MNKTKTHTGCADCERREEEIVRLQAQVKLLEGALRRAGGDEAHWTISAATIIAGRVDFYHRNKAQAEKVRAAAKQMGYDI